MKTSIQQMTKFLERKEAKEKCRLRLQVRHGDCTEYTLHTLQTLRTLRMVLTESRRLEREEGASATGGGAKKAARPKR